MNPQALHRHALTKFREAFGEPSNTLGPAAHWSLTCDGQQHPVHLLLNGGGEAPTIWLFDHDSPAGASAMNTAQSANDIDQVLDLVKQRIKHTTPARGGRNELVKFPVRINSFVTSVRGWADCMEAGRGQHAKIEVVKSRMFGLFINEDNDFQDAYHRNNDESTRHIDCGQSLSSLCTYFSALSDVVTKGHGRHPRR